MANLLLFLLLVSSCWCVALSAAGAGAGAGAGTDAFFSFDRQCNTFAATPSPWTDSDSDIDVDISLNCSLRFPPSPSSALFHRPIRFSSSSSSFSTRFSFSPAAYFSFSFSFFLSLPAPTPIPIPIPIPLLSLTLTTSLHRDMYQRSLHANLHALGLRLPSTSPTFFPLPLSPRLQLHSWIRYDATLHRLQLSLATSSSSSSTNTNANTTAADILSFSYPLNFSHLLPAQTHTLLLGFTASSPSSSTQNCTLYQWSFTTCHADAAPFLVHSDPLDPKTLFPPPLTLTLQKTGSGSGSGPTLPRPWGLVLALIFAAACGAMITFFAVFICLSMCPHRPAVAPTPTPTHYSLHPPHVLYQKVLLLTSASKPCTMPTHSHSSP